jgi:hypothetical protein
LACGALVASRAVDLDDAIALQHGASPVPAPTTPAPGGVLRRPLATVLTAAALAAGAGAGYLLAPADSDANRSPVVLAGTSAAASTTAPPTTPATTAAPPATDPGSAVATPTKAKAKANTKVAAVPAAGDAKPTTPAPVPAPTTTSGTAPAPSAKPKTTKTTKKTKVKAKPPASTTTPSGPANAAANALPAIDHVWVIGIGSPLPEQDDSYLGDVLRSRGTVLSHYTPVATEPLLGAAALVAGQAPSADAQTIAGQLAHAQRTWRSYAAGATNCDVAPGANPLLAFPTVTSAPGCADGISDLSQLAADLGEQKRTPAFSYISVDPALDPGALDALLQQVVPAIRASDAYRSGLIAIVPTSADPIAATGALLLSPFAAASTTDEETVGPYALLRTFEDLLGLGHLGHAADGDVEPLGADVLAPR